MSLFPPIEPYNDLFIKVSGHSMREPDIAEKLFPVLCSIGYFNTWSLRIKIEFLNKHPVIGKIFMTKYFNMKNPVIISE